MGRRKGSLNKKTIERLEAERMEAERLEAERLKSNLKNNPESSEFTPEINLKNKAQSVDKKISSEIIPTPKEDNLLRENQNEFEEEKNNKKDNVLEKVSDNKKNNNKNNNKNKSKNNTIICERCGKEVFSEPRKIDTNMLTGMADYYRESRRYVRLCDECCKELSKIVDEWLWMEEKGGNVELRKFEVGF